MKTAFLSTAWLYLAFVVYGSLVPLNFRPLAWDTAVRHFQHIPWLRLGIASRADWVANILLYIPLAFFWTAVATYQKHTVSRLGFSMLVLAGCLAVAFSVEFTQLFFPPRTVSINDLVAESFGSFLGVAGWYVAGDYVVKQLKYIKFGNFLSVKAAIFFYILIYGGLSLFPFDFVTSAQELDLKYGGENFEFNQCEDTFLRCSVRYGVEAFAVMPLAVLVCLWPNVPHKFSLNILLGFFIGVLIEGSQVFLVSGVAQGASIITRIVGMAAGVVCYRWARRFSGSGKGLRTLKVIANRLILPYVILVLAINGWLDRDWLAWPVAMEKLHDTYFLPFFYFYYTSEPVALISLLSNVGMYFPIGLLLWASSYNRTQAGNRWLAGGCAAGLALIVEISKLFLDGKHADPTDVLIAFAAGFGAYALANQVLQWVNSGKTEALSRSRFYSEASAQGEQAGIAVKNMFPAPGNFGFIAGLSALAAVVYLLFKYPLAPWALALMLMVYGYYLIKKPEVWLIVIPALLPVMDFAPWSGWFFVDEFDLVILTTLAVCWCRRPGIQVQWPGLGKSVAGVLILVYWVSVIRGLLPWQQADINAFNNYYSHYNSLRMAKGVLWAFLLAPYLLAAFNQNPRAKFYWGGGMLLGLAAMLAFAVMERLVFTGLWDFSLPYRISALFSSMHTGGGHIETYLALSLPFIGGLFFYSVRWGGPAALILFFTGSYVLLATFSRGGYLAFVVEFLVLVAGLAAYTQSQSRAQSSIGRWRPLGIGLALIGVVALMTIPAIQGDVIRQRFSTVYEDKAIRENHWLDAANMMDNDWATRWFGMGVGSYPRTYFLLNNENVVPGSYKIETESYHRYLRLKGGDALYMGQYIDVRAHRHYRLALDLRSPEGKPVNLEIPICEKSLLYSFNCLALSVKTANQSGWQTHELDIFSENVGYKRLGVGKPVQLALFAGLNPETVIDIDNVELIDETGRDLLANGDFSHGLDHWLFATDNHLPWHSKNIWVQVYFEQGWSGVISLALLLLAALAKLLGRISYQPEASILLSALAGFSVVGWVDSCFDAPRLTLLFLWVIAVALLDLGHAVKGEILK